VKLEESSSGTVSGSSAVEALRAQLLGRVASSTPMPKVTESVQTASETKTHQQLLEEVINNQIKAVKEESRERDELRERVGSARLDLIRGIL